ncbi:hypothetical protein [Mesorhizobium sp. LNHC229A00]|uniref:maleate cis-trans isomerase family protein n=1 Tax=Mesorhizobium sp. LNHC229A00 TaxID=1287240 RepID=UPI0012EBD12B|nr:hypothetical protein [Mesorhizobium sp. LNHC229A00]
MEQLEGLPHDKAVVGRKVQARPEVSKVVTGDEIMHLQPIGLGIVTPSGNSVIERDYPRLALSEVGFHFTRVFNSEDTAQQLSGMKAQAADAARLLGHVRYMKAIGFACTSGSFLEGLGYDESIVALMEEASGLPCVTTSGSVLTALRALGLRNLAVFSPYEEWLSNRLTAFLESHGVGVSYHAWGFDMDSTEELDRWGPINDWVIPKIPDSADGVFISCTNFTWLKGIKPLEQRLGRAVITSNLATLWNMLHVAGAGGRLSGEVARLADVRPVE